MRRTFGPDPSYDRVLNYKEPAEHHGMISIAGPCSIESAEQVQKVVEVMKESEVSFVRGGPWTFGTYPPEKPGLRRGDMKMFCKLVKDAGLRSIVECLDIRELDFIAQHADAIQIGARQMQNYPLLLEAGKLGKTVTLKRHVGCTVDEFLGACEYILTPDISKPILIERGSATYHNHVRWGADITLIAHIKKVTGVPVLVDASHGTGRRDLVEPVLLAGLMAGADGFLCETHPEPDRSRSDAEQAFPLSEFKNMIHNARGTYSLAKFQREGIGGTE